MSHGGKVIAWRAFMEHLVMPAHRGGEGRRSGRGGRRAVGGAQWGGGEHMEGPHGVPRTLCTNSRLFRRQHVNLIRADGRTRGREEAASILSEIKFGFNQLIQLQSDSVLQN